MGFNAALRLHLLTNSTLAGLVGNRAFPIGEEGPSRTTYDTTNYPFLTFQRITAERPRKLSGASGIARPRYQIDCLSLDADQVVVMAECVRDRLDGFRGVMGSGLNTVFVNGAELDTDDDSPVPRANDSELFVFKRELDFLIWHTEAVPTFAS